MTRARVAKRVRENGDRLVWLTNGKEYIEAVNTTFGIVRFGSKESALVYTLSDAVEVIRDVKVNSCGVHSLYAELIKDQSI